STGQCDRPRRDGHAPPRERTMTAWVPDIRRHSAQDIGAMRAMLSMMGRAFDEVDTYTRAQPDDDYLRRLLSGPHFIAITAVVEANSSAAWRPTNCRSSN